MKQLKVLTELQEIYLLVYFMFYCFSNSINTPKSSNDFMILIISFISSLEINKLNTFPALTAPFRLTFLPKLFNGFEAELLTNPGKLSLAKGITTFFSAFFLIANQELKDPPD